MGPVDRTVQLLHARIMSGASGHLAQVWFRAAVLDKYRQMNGAKILRTKSIGRLKLSQWGVDFGIVERKGGVGETLLHLSVQDAHARIPENEREHWAAHAVTLPVSTNFLLTQLTRGACIDDGELESW